MSTKILNAINLIELLPETLLHEMLSSNITFQNIVTLYEMTIVTRLCILDLMRINKLEHFRRGLVYTCGDRINGKLGDGHIKHYMTYEPRKINISNSRIVKISAGQSHTLFLDDKGKAYSCGFGPYGELGNGETIARIPKSINYKHICKKRIVDISANSFHSLFLCDDGTVYACGSGEYGTLGDRRLEDHNEHIPIQVFQEVSLKNKIISVSAGSECSFVICEDYSVYACGVGKHGRLGDGDVRDHNVDMPIKINNNLFEQNNIINITTADYNTAFLCNDGELYLCGAFASYCGLSIEDVVVLHHIPTKINRKNIGHRTITQISTCAEFMLILCDDGTVYACGYCKQYMLTGVFTDTGIFEKTPVAIDVKKWIGGEKQIVQLSVDESRVLFLCDDGSLYTRSYTPYSDNWFTINNLCKNTRIYNIDVGDHYSVLLTN